jgi:sugar O-acyltransferase (sialic acid O-acetyltransferase NeuD family)
MKELVIIGARGFGREVYSLAKRSLGYKQTFIIKGFLDDQADALESFNNLPPILSTVEKYQIQGNDVFICALGSVFWKKHYASIILNKGGNFINLIDKTAILGDNCNLGVGCIVCAHVIISNNVQLENFVSVYPFTAFGHDVQVGSYVHVGPYCFFGGYSTVEDEVTLHARTTVFDRVQIGKQAVIGAGVTVRKNITNNKIVIK